MEPSGRNQWQSAANARAPKSALTSQNRYHRLRPVAGRSARTGGVTPWLRKSAKSCEPEGPQDLTVRLLTRCAISVKRLLDDGAPPCHGAIESVCAAFPEARCREVESRRPLQETLAKPGLPRPLPRRVRQSSMSRTSFGVAGCALSRWSVRIALTSTVVPATAISFA